MLAYMQIKKYTTNQLFPKKLVVWYFGALLVYPGMRDNTKPKRQSIFSFYGYQHPCENIIKLLNSFFEILLFQEPRNLIGQEILDYKPRTRILPDMRFVLEDQ